MDQAKDPVVAQPPRTRSLHLLYHELRPARSDYTYALDITTFERQLGFFAALRKQNTPLRPEVTFDDGHLSNFEYALPALQEHAIQARFFITAGWTGNRPGYMDWRQLRALGEAGQHIGAHGWSHTLLTHCTERQLQSELRDTRDALEQGIGARVTTLSLPGGRSDNRVLAACAEAGYTTIYTSVPKSEPLPLGRLVGRLNILGSMDLPWIVQLFKPGSTTLTRLERAHRLKTTAKSLLGDNLYARLWGYLNREETPETSFEAPPYENPARHQ